MNGWRNPELKRRTLASFREGARIIVFDTETTGKSPETDRIIEFAGIIAKFTGTSIVQEESIDVYIRPPSPVSPFIEELTGLKNDFLSTCRPEQEEWARIAAFLDKPVDYIAGYNIGFDIGMVSSAGSRNNWRFPFETNRCFDVLQMARDVVPPTDTPKYKLGVVSHVLGLDEGVQFHNALGDSTVTLRLLEYCWREYMDAEKRNKPATKVLPEIFAINRWEGFRGFSRIYVQTNLGSVYYDVREKSWKPGRGLQSLEEIDMEGLEKAALKIANCSDLGAFAKYGKKPATEA